MASHPPPPNNQILRHCILQWTLVTILSIAVIVGALYLRALLRETKLKKEIQIQEDAVLLEANSIRYRLEAETLATFHLVTGLGTYISTNPNLSQDEYKRYASKIYHAKPGLVNIAAAPDLTIRYIYPLEGNEAALGLDYLKTPKQREAALAVKKSGQPVIAGPLELVQGGTAVIGRFPVYTESGFWGIVSTPIYLSQLLQDSGVLDDNRSIEIALRGTDGKGADGQVFFGDEQLFSEHSLQIPIRLFSGEWQLGAKPKQGWVTETPDGKFIDLFLSIASTLLISIFVLFNIYVLRLIKSREIEASVSRAKSRFLGIMSHEIRTPLNGITGIAHLMGTENLNPNQQELNSMIIRSAQALDTLLSDILNLSKLEHETFTPRTEKIQLQEILTPIQNLLKVDAEKKPISVIWGEIPADCQSLVIDPLLLRQIIWNLMSNAVKFTKQGEVRFETKIEANRKHHNQTLCITVTDTGIGIAEPHQKTVFDDFVQEDDSSTREFDGAGLGLAIVKRLIDSSKGTISLKSKKGKGSTFTVKLPIN